MNDKSKKFSDEMLRQLSERAATDEEFRTLCKQDVHAAIKQETGQDVPSNISIHVVDPSEHDLVLVLPKLQTDENELSDSELELAAGGTSRYTVVTALGDEGGEEPMFSYRGRIMTLSEYNKLAGIE